MDEWTFKMNFVEETLIELQSLGYSRLAVEHILELPVNSLSNNSNNPEVLVLMKILKKYPWILEVAEEKFDKIKAKQKMVYNAGQVLSSMAKDLNNEKQ